MATIADPWTVKHMTVAANLTAGVRHRVMVCMAVFALTSEYPASFSWNEEEGFAGTLGMTASAS